MKNAHTVVMNTTTSVRLGLGFLLEDLVTIREGGAPTFERFEKVGARMNSLLVPPSNDLKGIQN